MISYNIFDCTIDLVSPFCHCFPPCCCYNSLEFSENAIFTLHSYKIVFYSELRYKFDEIMLTQNMPLLMSYTYCF